MRGKLLHKKRTAGSGSQITGRFALAFLALAALAAASCGSSSDGRPAGGEGETETLTGQQIYMENCARCHGSDALGESGPAILGTTEEEITLAIDAVPLMSVTVADLSPGDVRKVAEFLFVETVVANGLPLAVAGIDQIVPTGTTAHLDGSLSSDPEGELLTYHWNLASFPGGSTAALSDLNATAPFFTADIDGDFLLTLTVNNGSADSLPDEILVAATSGNVPPVADAGTEQVVPIGAVVNLDGSGSSDGNGNLLTYSWVLDSRPAGSGALLSNPGVAGPSFTADAAGAYQLTLRVNDGALESLPATVSVTAATGNVPPVADAGPDAVVATGGLVVLDGSRSSDSNGDSLSYAWNFIALPSGSAAALSDPSVVNPAFSVDASGDYVLTLVVGDGLTQSAADTVVITATTGNLPPVADAGANLAVPVGAVVGLDGSDSSDADGDLLTYNWVFTALPPGSAAAISPAGTANPSFTADLEGDYVLSLTVNDGSVDGLPDTMVVSAVSGNVPPVANAGADQNVSVGDLVTLAGGTSSDADGDLLTYNWALSSKPTGSLAVLSNSTLASPSFTADVAGSFVVTLTVNDGSSESATDTVVVSAATGNVAPVANAGANQTVSVGGPVAMDGGASSDADDDPLSFAWTFSSRPGGSIAILTGATSPNAAFNADLAGDYILSLVVNDGATDSSPDSVVVSATSGNLPPVANAGVDQTGAVATQINLDGSASSDGDGDPLNFAWAFRAKPDGSTAGLSDPTVANPSFTPDVGGDYVISLTVNDGTTDGTPDTVVVSALTDNTAPVADAGADQTAFLGALVTLNGSGSVDADGDTLAYSWVFASRPAGSAATLASAATASPTFTPDGTGNFVLSLTVNDGTVNSSQDSITVTVTSSGASLYSANCESCHGPGGNGTAGIGPNIQGKTKAEIDVAIATVIKMKNRPNLVALTAAERQVIADFLAP